MLKWEGRELIELVESRMEKAMGQFAGAIDDYYAACRRLGVSHDFAVMLVKHKFGLSVALVLEESKEQWWAIPD